MSGIMFLLLASLFPLRPDEPVDLAGQPPASPLDLTNAHGRLDIEYLLIPEEKLEDFTNAFDSTSVVPDVGQLLKKSGAKVVATASTSLCLGGDGAMLEIADSRLTLRPRIVAPTQFHLDGRITRSSFSGTFDVLLAPGRYQLFIMWDQPPHGNGKDPYNAIVARMREISVEGPNGEVHTLLASPAPLPLPPPTPTPPPPNPAPQTDLIPPAPPALPKVGNVLYENRGDNTKGFVLKHPSTEHPEVGALSFSVHDHTLAGNYDATNRGWCALPVAVNGDFQIDFDVRPDANDACAFLMLFDNASNQGLAVANSTNTSFGTHSLYVFSVKDLTDGQQLFYDHAVLASAEAKKFPDQAWTHVTVSKIGNRLIDNVGGQVIIAQIPPGTLPAKVHLGIGYYATKNVGGNGRIAYANIRVIPQP
jgi:hypothetical protein